MRIWQGRLNTCATAQFSDFVHSLKERKRAENLQQPQDPQQNHVPGYPLLGTKENRPLALPSYLLLPVTLTVCLDTSSAEWMSDADRRSPSCSPVNCVPRWCVSDDWMSAPGFSCSHSCGVWIVGWAVWTVGGSVH